MKGFIGTANVDTNSRLCMASSVAGHRRAFGSDTVPGCYEDLDAGRPARAGRLERRLVPSGAVPAHAEEQAGARRRIVVIDPRRTATSEDADLFLGLKPGTDTALFSGLLVHLADNGALDRDYIGASHAGFDEALARAREIAGAWPRPRWRPGSPSTTLRAFFALFAQHAARRDGYSQGVNQSAQGTDKVNAIINCHLATGRIGKAGRGAVLADRPAECDGRARGRRPRQPACRAHGFHAAGHRPRAAVLEGAAHRAARRPEGRADVRGDRPRRDQGAVGDGHQSRGVAAGRRCGARGARQARAVRRFRERAVERHGQFRRACAAARRMPGARSPAPSPIPSGASRASAPS